MERHERKEDGEGPITQAFLEGLFTSLREDLQALKRDLSQDLKVVRGSGTIRPSMLDASIVVIPKAEKDPTQLNMDIKLLMGIVAFHLNPPMPGLVDPDLEDFIPHWQCVWGQH
ncbi:hypothetical protein NDU88_002579 [Pleurodeles waltl]|uniref:Uncharacterized protein n=1 Tax=Pleurodeles waltl TaxID=8319 RepID=A0AAV7W037_PLEWA|nr:hypothetical protein NDU88_002579 [Pleurodeles waltl]